MALFTVLCALVVCSTIRKAFTCEERDVEVISREIADVEDWQGLAGWLNIGSRSIEEDCARSTGSPTMCRRRELVRRYCNGQSSPLSEVVEDVAKALEEIGHKRQAEQVRQLKFGPPVTKQNIKDDDSYPPHSTCTSSPPTITSLSSLAQHTQPPCQSPSHLTRYADYLRAVYAKSPVAIDRDKWPPSPSTTYIRLALVKKEKVSRSEADNFTCLTLQGDIDQILRTKQPITMEDVLKGEGTRLVVVEGAPGIGKSTFTWELCRQWPKLESLKYFSLVVLLRLREEGVQTATAISDLLYHRNTELCRSVGEEVERREGEGVLFVFDGFDELPAELRRKSLVVEVISGSYLPKATVLVTSRPSATAELLSVFQALVSKHIEVVGFSDKEIQEYAESVLGSGSKLLASFQRYLSVNPVVRGMMYNPLSCGIVVEVYRYNYLSHRPIPHTQTQLYTELSLCLLSRHLSTAEDPLARKLLDRLGDLDRLEDIPHDSELYQQLVRLGRLAFEGRVREEVIFKVLPEGCSALGLLNTYSELYGRREKVTYNFLHLTLQEYLGAFYISQLPASEQRKSFVEHRKLGHLNVVWKFVAGLTRMQDIGWEGFRGRNVMEEGEGNIQTKMFERYSNFGGIMDEIYWPLGKVDRGYEVVGGVVRVYQFVVQCLYEAQDAGSCDSVFGQSKVTYHGQECSTPLDAYAIGYSVSLCANDWNVDLMWNGFGPEVVEMFLHGLNSTQYAHGAVEGLRLSNNPIKDEGIEYLQQFPHQILQQMRTLQLRDCKLGRKGFNLLADIVPLLSNLESLDVSFNSGGTEKLLQALGKHEKVETLAMYLNEIDKNDVMALSEVVHQSGSLRELQIGAFRCMAPECVQQLMRRALSPSSLQKLVLQVSSSVSPLDYIENISNSLTRLEFKTPLPTCGPWGAPSEQQPTQLGHTKLSNILKENTTLKVLQLFLPLGNTEVRAIVKSLKHNHHPTELWLSKRYHSRYFSVAERQAFDHRIKWYI